MSEDYEKVETTDRAATATPTENPSSESAKQEAEDESQYPHGLKLAVIILSNMIAMFLVALDRTIITTAIPRTTDDFKSLGDISWYASAYLITSSATQLLWGRIFTFYSTKVVYLVAIFFFELGSLLCGVAPNSVAFIIGRAIAGAGSAGIYSGSTILITTVTSLSKRAGYVSMMGAVFGIASVIAPLIGGAFTDRVTWRWCFYINLPVGAAAVAALLFLFPSFAAKEPTPIKQQIKQLDPFGNLVFLPGVICLILALQWGGEKYPWNEGRIIALLVLACVLLIIFVAIQVWQQENATVPPSPVQAAESVLIIFLVALPIWFQGIRGTDAVTSGIDTLPLVLSLVFGAIVSGGVINGIGWFNPVFFSSDPTVRTKFPVKGIPIVIFMAVGGGLISTFVGDTPTRTWIGYQIILGLGIGQGMQLASLGAQVALAQRDVPIGVSLMLFAQSLGGSVLVCVAQAVFNNELRSRLGNFSGLDVDRVIGAGATQLRNFLTPDILGNVLVEYNAALRRYFYVGLAAACFAILPSLGVEWKNVKGKEFVH
ncbi:major facilitator superfamily domain-containing protein [Colletotrichum phormii]|uniref:Major facilitator superfamily domain-containing protein n=1 Tax=Colletotrichum phormii TaxID=359342 RepID=A0AAJ0A074_9PEZI|nr:major facilitator superfamily domain-containing protein [Colletotrichum phormii]KAK1640034.1 major facilitator superfamily domain-containing protein [Colletotrichum phormii]